MWLKKLIRMRKLIEKIYAKRLESRLRKDKLPKSIMIVTDYASFKRNFEKFVEVVSWCRKFAIDDLIICFEKIDDDIVSKLKELGSEVEVVKKNGSFKFGSGRPRVLINAGITGKEEILLAVKKILEEEDIDLDNIERLIEESLKFKVQPDLIIKADDSIPDFLIWQSIYSELYFLDTDWESFRYVDFLRCLRDYQRRERRYGK